MNAATPSGIQVFDPTGRLCSELLWPARSEPAHIAFEGDRLTVWTGSEKYTRKLNTTGVLDEVLVTLIEATLRLTRAERGYVFLAQQDGSVRLAAGFTDWPPPIGHLFSPLEAKSAA